MFVIGIKAKKFIKIAIKSIIFLVICLVLGFFMGYLSANYIDNIIPSSWRDNIFVDILVYLIPFLILIISYLVHIIIHELGHLIFGLATDYSFVSFRIGSFTVIKEDDKFKRKKYSIPGTAGQCLMMPPEIKEGKYPFIIYNLGGVILNAIVSLICILPVIFMDNLNLSLELLLILFCAAGVIVVLSNGIPLKISGIANDGYNVISIKKDEDARKGFYLQLRVHGLLSRGMRYREIDYNLFKLKEDADLSNPINTSLKLMEYEWYLDSMDFDNARKCIDSFIPYLNKIIPLYTHEINCERIFLELIGGCDKGFVDGLYSKNLKKYIKASKFMMNKKRLMMAYEAFYKEDKEKAIEYYKEINKLYKDYPNKGEAEMELMLADWIKERKEVHF